MKFLEVSGNIHAGLFNIELISVVCFDKVKREIIIKMTTKDYTVLNELDGCDIEQTYTRIKELLNSGE